MSEQRQPTTAEASARIETTGSLLEEHATISLAAVDGDQPWVTIVYFVQDEPAQGSLDLCCSLLMSPQRRALFERGPRVAFVAAGEDPDRWLHGSGTAEIVQDEADAAAIAKRLADRAPEAAMFLERLESTPVRIHVGKLKVTDLDAEPPVTEFTFA